MFPNVVTPLSASLYRGAMDRGQAAAAVEWGMLTEKQVAGFRPDAAWLTGVFGGYLYGNVTAARSAVGKIAGSHSRAGRHSDVRSERRRRHTGEARASATLAPQSGP